MFADLIWHLISNTQIFLFYCILTAQIFLFLAESIDKAFFPLFTLHSVPCILNTSRYHCHHSFHPLIQVAKTETKNLNGVNRPEKKSTHVCLDFDWMYANNVEAQSNAAFFHHQLATPTLYLLQRCNNPTHLTCWKNRTKCCLKLM